MELANICGIQPCDNDNGGNVHYIQISKDGGSVSILVKREFVSLVDAPFNSEAEILQHLLEQISTECQPCSNSKKSIDAAKETVARATYRGKPNKVDNLLVYKGVGEIDAGIIVTHSPDKSKWNYFLVDNWKDYYRNII